LKEKGIHKFSEIQSQFDRQRGQQERQLKDGEGERRILQDKMNNLEKDLDDATTENLKLKGLTFDLDYRVGYYSMIVDQLNKKVKLMNEKQHRMVKEIEYNQGNQDKELRRV